MGSDIRTILGARNMIGTAQGIKDTLPTPLPPELYASNETVEGNTGEFTRVNGNRELARIVAYGSPSVKVGLSGIEKVPISLIHTFEHHVHRAATLLNLMAEDDDVKQERGMQTIARQTKDFMGRFNRLRVTAVHMALLRGIIYVAENGAIQDTSSGAKFSIDFQIPASNKNQLNLNGGGDVLTENWTSATAKIIKELEKVRNEGLIQNGWEWTTILYGSNILDYLLTNNQTKEIINRNPAYQQEAIAGRVPQGLAGYNWYPASKAMYMDNAGAMKTIADPDALVLIPDVDADWWDMLQGTFLVPTDIGLKGDAIEAIQSLTEAEGVFQYAEILTDPVGIKHYGGDTFLPVIKAPKAVAIGKVKTS